LTLAHPYQYLSTFQKNTSFFVPFNKDHWGWKYVSSGRAPALQVQTPDSPKKKKARKGGFYISIFKYFSDFLLIYRILVFYNILSLVFGNRECGLWKSYYEDVLFLVYNLPTMHLRASYLVCVYPSFLFCNVTCG
jgi:hypothetical protein